jgi:hypothetical protein
VTIERTFDAAGRETLRTNLKADGTALGIYTATYDPLCRLVTDQRDGSYSFNRTYTYDEVGNRLTKSDSGAICTYGYDPGSVLPYGKRNRYRATRPVAEKARAAGYDIIKYKSERGPGCSYAVIDHWNDLLEPLDRARLGPEG